MTQEEAEIGESAVRLGDQARVRRALDKFVAVHEPPENTTYMPDVLVIQDSLGNEAFEVRRGASVVEARKYLESCFVAFLEEVLRG